MEISIKEKLDRLLCRYKNNIIKLDALYQWGANPTCVTAIRNGCPPNHKPIKDNLKIRYNLDDAQADNIYNELVKDAENEGIDFAKDCIGDDYIGYHHILKRFDEEYGDILRKKTFNNILSSSKKDQYITYLYVNEKVDKKYNFSNPFSFPHYDWDRGNLDIFRLAFSVISKLPLIEKDSEIINILVKLGLINRLEHNGSKCNSSIEYIFPQYLNSIISEIISKIQLPDLPDYSKYMSFLIDNHDLRSLICLDDILKRGFIIKRITYSNRYTYNAFYGQIKPEACIVATSTNKNNPLVVINPRIYNQFKDLFFKEKLKKLKLKDRLTDGLNKLYEKYYPKLFIEPVEENHTELFNSCERWQIDSNDTSLFEPETMVILSPWITGSELENLKNKKSVVIILTFMGLPEFYTLYKAVFYHPFSENSSNWMIIDTSKEKVYETFVNTKSPLFIELKKIIDEAAGSCPVPKTLPMIVKTEKHVTIDTPFPFPPTKNSSKRLKVLLGYSDDHKEITWEPGKLINGNLVIIGSSGAGKTETIKAIASEISTQGFPILMIDFHGDMAYKNCNIHTYKIDEESPYYFNPLDLDPQFPEITPLTVMQDFNDAIGINFPSIGIQQRDCLSEIIKDSYNDLGINNKRTTWSKELPFSYIVDKIRNSEDKTTQTLKGYINKISDFNLFSGSEKISIGNILSGKITHINLKSLPESLRSLYADLLLRKIYYTLQSLGHIPAEDISDKDKFRLFVIVDEAKLLVKEKQGTKAVLNKYATETRKFGASLILASQLVTHFKGEILNNVAAKLCMRPGDKDQANKNSKYFDVDTEKLMNLDRGVGIFVKNVHNKVEKETIEIIPTWKRYSHSNT